jgi:thiol-disulfide isomerase/thioredoxin
MKVTIAFSLLFLTFSAMGQTYSDQERDSINKAFFEAHDKSNRELINKPFPPFSYTDRGEIIDNNYLKGKTVFINFWFEACAPCIAEFEAFNEMYTKLKGNPNFEFISFTFETSEKAEEIKNKYQIKYKIFSIRREECYRLNNNNGFPTSMIIDSLGLIKYRTSGGNSNKDKARQFVMTKIYPEILKNF